MPVKVCIVGSGASGLASIKSCLEESMEVVCYERNNDIGGMWNPNYPDGYSGGRIYKSLIPNNCKEISCFSDFPFHEDVPVFPSSEQYLEYLHSYSKHFDLRSHIIFNREVLEVTEIKSGWEVVSRDVASNKTSTSYFDCIIICCGNFTRPFIPPFKGLQEFRGNVIHSSQYIACNNYIGIQPEIAGWVNHMMDSGFYPDYDKNVLIVGFGSSGCDIACEVSRVAKNTFASCRDRVVVIPRLCKHGIPHDLSTMNRFEYMLSKLVPTCFMDWYLQKRYFVTDADELKFNARFGANNNRTTSAINDEAVMRVTCGCIKLKPRIAEIKDDKILFSDNTEQTVDAIIFATGYKKQFPFISDDILPDDIENSQLYKWVFPTTVQHPGSIAVVGLIAVTGFGAFPAVELQSRYAAYVMSGSTTLPSKEILKKRVKTSMMRHWTNGSFNMKLPIFSYLEEIAQSIEVRPTLLKLMLINPLLVWYIYFGPFIPCHYRITGPHPWTKINVQFLRDTYNRLYSAFNKIKTS